MTISIHQPNYLPYLGFFEKAHRSEVFILYDSTQFKKNDWQNRNKLCINNGWQWITIPILHNFGQKIYETRIDPTKKGLKSNWQTIKTIYGQAPYFKNYAEKFEQIYSKKFEFLADLNCELILLISEILHLNTKFIRSTTLPGINTKSTQALIDFCTIMNADTYISGAEGCNYIEMELFLKKNIKVIFQDYKHPKYNQFNTKEFQSHMSIIDLIFNCGEASLNILSS